MEPKAKSVWDYTDYRAFLKAAIAAGKEAGKPLSNRWFAKGLGMNTSSYMTSLLQGKRKLNQANTARMCQLLKLRKAETAYFEALVAFNQADKVGERDKLYRALMLVRKRHDAQTLTRDQYDYYGAWYHSAVRALVHKMATARDYSGIADRLQPPVTEAQVRKSLELLEKLGLIGRGEKGRYVVSNASITTGEDIQSLQVANFQRETLKLAWEGLDRIPKEERDFSTMTLGVSEAGFREVTQIIRDCRQRIREAVRRDSGEEQVYQLNIQLFPMSKTSKPRSGDV